MGTKTPKSQGEGDREAARHYDNAQRDFVESGKVEQAARDAAPQSEQEAEEMRRAEEAGKSRAKEEDPAVAIDNTRPSKVRK